MDSARKIEEMFDRRAAATAEVSATARQESTPVPFILSVRDPCEITHRENGSSGGAMARRTQAERSEETTAALVRAARELFGGKGYAATSIDAVAAAAGVTKGAAYHHFGGKAPLFRAAFEAELAAVYAKLEAVAAEEGDPWAALRRGARTFLEHCLDPGFQRIVMLDAPAVLGWEQVREAEHEYLLRMLLAGFQLAAEGDEEAAVSARAQLAFGALCEAGMLLARSPSPADDLPRVVAEAERLLRALGG